MERALQLWIKGADEERHALHHRVQRREDRHFDGGRVAVAAQTDERADHGRDERLEGVGRRLFDEVSEAQGALLALLGGALEQAVEEHGHEWRCAAMLAQAGEGRRRRAGRLDGAAQGHDEVAPVLLGDGVQARIEGGARGGKDALLGVLVERDEFAHKVDFVVGPRHGHALAEVHEQVAGECLARRRAGTEPAEELEDALVQGVDACDGLEERVGDVVPDLRLVVARGGQAAEDDADLRRQRGAGDGQQGDERRGVRGRHGHVCECRDDDGEDDVGLRAHDFRERRERRGRALVVECVEERGDRGVDRVRAEMRLHRVEGVCGRRADVGRGVAEGVAHDADERVFVVLELRLGRV